MKYKLIKLGCPKNDVDADNIELGLTGNFIKTDKYSDCNVVIINTCAFIKPALEESFEYINKAINYKKKYNYKIVVTGCLPSRNIVLSKRILKNVDLFLKFNELNKINDLFNIKITKKINRSLLYKNTNKLYAYVKIAEGCNKFCSYCTIPFIKDRFKSRKIENIINEIKHLLSVGIKEIILVAQDTGFYGLDIYKKKSLLKLLKKITKLKKKFRVRVLYLNPEDITEDLIDFILKNPKICNYFDIPIQHTDNKILKAMNRKVNNKQIYNIVNYIRKKNPNAILRTTIITGFPGENENNFKNLIKDIKKLKFNHLGVFSYFNEEGTSAYKLKNHNSDTIKNERTEILIKEQLKIVINNNKNIINNFSEQKFIIDGIDYNNKYLIGYTDIQTPEMDGFVFIKYDKLDNINLREFINIKLNQFYQYDFIGEII